MVLRFSWLIPFLCYTVWSKKIKQVFAWCTTAGAIGYIVSVVTRRPLILESYEPHAEAMVENGHWTTKHPAYKILSYFEKRQAVRASYIIAANAGMRQYVQQRYNYSIPENIFFAKPACVDLEVFYPDDVLRNQIREQLGFTDGDIVCLYAGKFGGIYLKDEVFDLLKVMYDFWGKKFRILLLTGHSVDEIKELSEKSNLPFEIVTVLFVKHEDVSKYMRAGDFALCPVKPVPTKRYCTPVKDGEYWATGLPVVITKNISDDSLIIEENNTGVVLYDLSTSKYVEATEQIDKLLQQDRKSLSDKIRFQALKHRNYKIAEDIYRKIFPKE